MPKLISPRAGGLAAGLVLTLAGLGVPAPAAASAPAAVAATAAADPALVGTTPEQAAGSCWEIKRERPSAASGVYWLLTPEMAEPQRFYCDQTTDGGGWVLVGKGRNGWTMDDSGRGSVEKLLDPGYAGAADTHQYSAELIDQLIGGTRPIDLPDGIRVRRAQDSAGTQWQEVRFRPNTRQTGWSWAFGARFDVSSWSFSPGGSPGTSTVSGTGGASDYFGTGSSWARVGTVPAKVTGWTSGFAYGDSVTGTSSSSSYLWAPTGGGARGIPVAQVYLRPRLSSDDADFNALPEAGTPQYERRALPESNGDALPWGVSGLAGSTSREGSVEVQELLEAHGRMYVGGNFRYVQRDAAGTGRVDQPFLAAFDLDTGAWISSFRPDLNEQVRTLELSSTGAIIAAGDFTRANGAAASAIVALDPDTGATDRGFNLTIDNRLTGGMLRVWALERLGTTLYIGGDFTHLKGGPSAGFTYMRGLARVRLTDGRTTAGWNPEMNGTVVALDASADGSRVYAAGHFTVSRGVTARRAAAVLTQFETRSDGSVRHLATPAWTPTWSSWNDYQQAIVEAGGNVWVGGSEHSLFGFDASTFQRMSTTILHQKGDVQAMTTRGDVLFAGSHANNQYAYTGATTWSGSGAGGDPWTSVHTQHWVGAYDVHDGRSLSEFAPSMQMRLGSGVWATTVDYKGRLWVGGDIESVRTSGGARFSGGFARFAARDVNAPRTPGSFRVISSTQRSITLAWSGVTDPSGVRYQVLRNDRPVATTTKTQITIPRTSASGSAERYFVRAADRVGNRSASTPALHAQVPANLAPAGEGDATSQQPTVILVDRESDWTWRYSSNAIGSGWTTVGFNDSGWRRGGTAPLGFAPAGAESHLGTDIDSFATTAERPIAAHFRQAFTVADPAALQDVVIRGVADDGAVFYVNGVEVGRQNMPAGVVTPQTYASSTRRVSVAEASPVLLEVPASLLVAGTNVIAAETHLHDRGTPDLTFHLTMDARATR